MRSWQRWSAVDSHSMCDSADAVYVKYSHGMTGHCGQCVAGTSGHLMTQHPCDIARVYSTVPPPPSLWVWHSRHTPATTTDIHKTGSTGNIFTGFCSVKCEHLRKLTQRMYLRVVISEGCSACLPTNSLHLNYVSVHFILNQRVALVSATKF